MRRWLLPLALIAALSLPLFAAAPASAGFSGECPDGYQPIPIAVIQGIDSRPGVAHHAAAADVNHNQIVCFQFQGAQGRGGPRLTDDIPFQP